MPQTRPNPTLTAVKNYDGIRILWSNRSVRCQNASFGQVVYEPGGVCGPRIQRDFELVIIHSGEAQVVLDGERRALNVGSINLFLPKHREHFLFSEKHKTHHSWCTASRAIMPASLARELVKAPFSISTSDFFERIFATALMMGVPRTASAERVIEHLAVLLFAEFLHLGESGNARLQRTASLHRALAHVEAHFGDENCMEEAREASGISRNALAAQFSRAFSQSPNRYLWQFRTERGIAMLTETGLTISEIAYRCGFKTPFHFSRLVKGHQGISPREVRKRHWKQPGEAKDK